MKKVLIVLFLLSAKLAGQSRVEGHFLSKNEWKHLVNKFFPLNNDTLYIVSEGNLGVPDWWTFDNEVELFLTDSTSSLFVSSHRGVLGRYVFYLTRTGQSYVQPFFQISDRTLCYKVAEYVYVFESFIPVTLYGTPAYIYTIYNHKLHEFSPQIVELYGHKMKIEKVLSHNKTIKFSIKYGLFNKENMLFDIENNLFIGNSSAIVDDAVYKATPLPLIDE
jgi:hypothetical protein